MLGRVSGSSVLCAGVTLAVVASPSSGPEGVGDVYRDRWIVCTPSEVQIHGYYFPWGTKHIPYSSIRSVQRVTMGAFTGQARIWGTSNPRYWAHLDPARPRKNQGLILDLGKRVLPYITPDDVDAVEALIWERAGFGPGSGNTQSPVV